ncbi:hypothetical protein [Streptosporangium sp. NPDC002721]|uniref:hypothetical protein n=1 Tax=Streptosporangium sp. NPDC002721 TaxID=3366188 RepID=UPI0036A9914B
MTTILKPATPALPEPLEVPWTMKPVTSAESGADILDDGRLHLWIRHDLVHGVSPAMLVWWFRNVEGDMELLGRRVPRYRVWHPLDHVGFRYHSLPPGGAGPGAVFHLHEVLGRDPDRRVDVLTRVTRLDEGGFAHRPRTHGLPVARMDYTFARVAGGTRYENSLTLGLPGRGRRARLVRPVNEALRDRIFPGGKGAAWLRHNIEEVGNFEFFLPGLCSAEGLTP